MNCRLAIFATLCLCHGLFIGAVTEGYKEAKAENQQLRSLLSMTLSELSNVKVKVGS